MPDTFGYSFQPGLQQRFTNALNGQAAQLPPTATQALQVLSLHLPQLLQGAPIAPDALLQARHGAGGGLALSTLVATPTSQAAPSVAQQGPDLGLSDSSSAPALPSFQVNQPQPWRLAPTAPASGQNLGTMMGDLFRDNRQA